MVGYRKEKKSRVGKVKVMLPFAANVKCISIFFFSFQFPALDVSHSKFKKSTNLKIFFPVPYPIIYKPCVSLLLKKLLCTTGNLILPTRLM